MSNNEIFHAKYAKILTLLSGFKLAKAFHSSINLENFLIMIKNGHP